MEELDEQFLGRFRLLIAAAIRHRLATTSLVKWTFEIDIELLRQLNGSYSG
jgi:hypothetical protein